MTPLIFPIVYNASLHFSLVCTSRKIFEKKINGTSSESNQAKSQMFGSGELFKVPMIACASTLPLVHPLQELGHCHA